MRVLIVKTSSMGDVIHTLPALTDAASEVPDVRFHWVVEEALDEIPAWHPAVERVIPVALRRWRRRPIAALISGQWRGFRKSIKATDFDKVIDAQGLIKSAWIARMARGHRCGFARAAAREPLAALAYRERHAIPRGQHAVNRLRQLFAACLGYTLPGGAPDYGIDASRFHCAATVEPYVVFLHGTTWTSKLWPEKYWLELARLASDAENKIYLPWGDDQERARVERIAAEVPNVRVLDKLSLSGLAEVLSAARAVAAVDTGLAHLAAALSIPCVTVYGATRPGLTGTVGAGQVQLRAQFECSPCLRRECSYTGPAEVNPACYASVDPAKVWHEMQTLMTQAEDTHRVPL
jgi:heptosyltransferase-1